MTALVNYGLDRVRFPSAVPTGSTLYATDIVDAVDAITDSQQIKATIVVHREDFDEDGQRPGPASPPGEFRNGQDPTGPLLPDPFTLVGAPLTDELHAGEVRVRTWYVSPDPTNRVWFFCDSYLLPLAVGDVIRGAALGSVEEADNERSRQVSSSRSFGVEEPTDGARPIVRRIQHGQADRAAVVTSVM